MAKKNLEKLNERTKIKKKLLGEKGYILTFYQSDSRNSPLLSLPGNFWMKWSNSFHLQRKASGTDNLSSVTISKREKKRKGNNHSCSCHCCCVTTITMNAGYDISFMSRHLRIARASFGCPPFLSLRIKIHRTEALKLKIAKANKHNS